MSNPEGTYLSMKELPAGAFVGRIVGLKEERTPEYRTFEGQVKPEITGKGRPYKELCKNTITAGEAASLFNTYLLRELDALEGTELDEEQSEILDFLFERIGKGFVCANGVDYDRGDKKAKKPNETYRSVLWVTKPDDFEFSDGIWKPVCGEGKPKVIPAPGFVGLTSEGAYDSDGAPLETWDTREQAERTWTSRGFPEDFAKIAVSYSFSREEGQGTSALSCGCWGGYGGRFDLGAYGDPDGGLPSVGGFVRK